MKKFGMLIFLAASTALILPAATFTQCPPTGVNTGCEFLLTVNSNNSVTVTGDMNAPNNGPYDGSDDTLVGVQNNSSATITSLPLSSSADIFGFEGDGPCSVSPAPSSCPSSAGFPADPSGYGGPGVTYSGISSDNTSGIVDFSPGIAPGGSAWFGLEEALTLSQIIPGTPGGGPIPSSGVPEPSTYGLLALGMLGLVGFAKRRFLRG